MASTTWYFELFHLSSKPVSNFCSVCVGRCIFENDIYIQSDAHAWLKRLLTHKILFECSYRKSWKRRRTNKSHQPNSCYQYGVTITLSPNSLWFYAGKLALKCRSKIRMQTFKSNIWIEISLISIEQSSNTNE